MYALKYGTIPLVRATGGLNDSIETFEEKTGKGNGFKFRPYDSEALLNEIKRAVRLFKNKKVWKRLMLTAMAADFSWDRSAKAYLDLYNTISRDPSPK
jgi:starch synthase